MNRALAKDYITLRLADKQYICREIGFGVQHAHESNAEWDKRFLSFVANEGKVRQLEELVIERSKRG